MIFGPKRKEIIQEIEDLENQIEELEIEVASISKTIKILKGIDDISIVKLSQKRIRILNQVEELKSRRTFLKKRIGFRR